MTLEELKEKLSEFDEVTLLELLNLRSGDLVAAFEYLIEARFEQLEKEVDENE
jgi:hypothetical protein